MTCNKVGGDDSERELIAALKAGQTAAVAVLHARYLDRVYGYVLRRVSQCEDAEDITCEVFASAVQSITKLRGDAGLIAWLLGIARRKIADHLRRTGRRREVREADLSSEQLSSLDGLEWTEDLPEQVLQREEVRRAVRDAVRQLPEAQQETLLLRHVEGLSIGEISRVIGRSENAVKALLHRAKASLWKHLAPACSIALTPDESENDHETSGSSTRTPLPEALPAPTSLRSRGRAGGP